MPTAAEFECPLCRAQIQRPSVGPPAMGRFRASADRALVNGAAPASPPSASIANAGAQAPTTFSRPSVLVMFYAAWRGCPLLLPLRRRPDRLSTLHAKGLLSPRPARRQIRLGDRDDGAPRPSGRRLRHLGCAPPRSSPLRRLFRRPRISRPAPRQANRGDAAPPPRQKRRRLTARLSEEAVAQSAGLTARNRTDKKPASLEKG